MLVLSRKNQESVVVGAQEGLGSTVKVTVVEISLGRVKLGFEADKNVPVYREEVWERIRSAGQRDPPFGNFDRTGSRSSDGKTEVLSGVRERKPRVRNTAGKTSKATGSGQVSDFNVSHTERTEELGRWEDDGGEA